MYMKKFILFAILGGGLALSSCERHYVEPYPPVENTYTFVDEFVDNRNGWAFADQVEDAYGVVTGNGTFAFSYLDPYGIAYYRSKDIRFNPDKNFVLQTRIGSDNNMGLLFGFDDRTGAYGYSFTVDYDGYVALWDEGGNGNGNQDIVAVVEPFRHNAVNRNGNWNDLVLEQVGNNWIGYVNDVKVFTVRAQYLAKGSVGFVVVGNTRGEADYIQADFY